MQPSVVTHSTECIVNELTCVETEELFSRCEMTLEGPEKLPKKQIKMSEADITSDSALQHLAPLSEKVANPRFFVLAPVCVGKEQPRLIYKE